jgi:hypothetical protein
MARLNRSHLLEALRRLEDWGEGRSWTGSDPYEGLNATRLVGPLRRARLGRRLAIQAVKRSPLDLRPILGIRPAQNSMAVAHVVSSHALGGFLPEAESAAKRERYATVLDGLRCEGYEEPCWGYHFDVETRVLSYPRGAPNTIATSFAAQALLDAYEAGGNDRWLELAAGAGDFFLRRVPQTDTEKGGYFGYLAGDSTPIHNANLLACASLARLHRHTGRRELRERAEAGLVYALARQRPEGSWPYGEEPHLQWIDNYHTGYVLEALLICSAAGLEPAPGAALERGLDYYRRALFEPDGAPRFVTKSLYPIDSQCVAQGIQTFALAGQRDPARLQTAWRVFEFAQRRMRRDDGSFIFQRRRLWVNRAPHIRWVEAPMLLALAHLLRRVA